RRGAVHLTIPVDVFTEQASACVSVAPTDRNPTPFSGVLPIDLLRQSERPVVIAGSGVWWSGAEAALRNFIERWQIPLYTITMARGAVSDDPPLCMGSADPALNRAAHRAFAEADLFLIVGKRIDYRLAMGGTRLFPKHARFIQIDIHPQEFGLNRSL